MARRPRLGKAPRQPEAALRMSLAIGDKVAASLVAQLEEALGGLSGEGEMTEAQAKRLAKRVAGIKPPRVGGADALFAAADRANRREIARQLEGAKLPEKRQDARRKRPFSVGVSVPELSNEIGRAFRREHVARIVSQTERVKEAFLKFFVKASKRGLRFEAVRDWLIERKGVEYRRARLIARDQILTLNAQITQSRHEALGIEQYRWRTVSDGSSRQHHRDLDGTVQRYDDPPMGGGTGPDDRGNPGDGIGCRCQAIPVLPDD